MEDGGDFPGGCSTTGPVRTTLPLPTNATTDCDANNNSAGVLQTCEPVFIQAFVPTPAVE
jgi:hypothetical protein